MWLSVKNCWHASKWSSISFWHLQCPSDRDFSFPRIVGLLILRLRHVIKTINFFVCLKITYALIGNSYIWLYIFHEIRLKFSWDMQFNVNRHPYLSLHHNEAIFYYAQIGLINFIHMWVTLYPRRDNKILPEIIWL
jgi:hypothetical protein